MTAADPSDPRWGALIDMLRRTGAAEVQLRYSDDEEPTIWMAAALYQEDRWDAAAAADPFRALCRLLDQVIDGGTCTHCGRPTGFSEDPEHLPLAEVVCWYQFDPSTNRIVRGCE